jgi:acetyl-CoA C-acetyltransferase
MACNPNVDWQMVTDVIYGCANQAGDYNHNVARMSSLLAGLPLEVPGSTINCRSLFTTESIAACAMLACTNGHSD